MKIINLDTNIIFDLPKREAENIISLNPDLFAKISKNKKVVKNKNADINQDSVLTKILDE